MVVGSWHLKMEWVHYDRIVVCQSIRTDSACMVRTGTYLYVRWYLLISFATKWPLWPLQHDVNNWPWLLLHLQLYPLHSPSMRGQEKIPVTEWHKRICSAEEDTWRQVNSMSGLPSWNKIFDAIDVGLSYHPLEGSPNRASLIHGFMWHCSYQLQILAPLDFYADFWEIGARAFTVRWGPAGQAIRSHYLFVLLLARASYS